MAHDPMVHMAGLAVGITVHPGAGWTEPARGKARVMHLFVQEGTPTKPRPGPWDTCCSEVATFPDRTRSRCPDRCWS